MTEKRRIVILGDVIAATLRVFQTKHRWGSRHEGIVYWAGLKCRDEDLLVTTCVAPHAITTPGSYSTSSADNAEAISAMNNERVQLIAQVHSHPGRCVDHSNGDGLGALMPFEDFFSIVVPHYGMRGMWPLDVCGVYQYTGGRFLRLHIAEIGHRFRVVHEFIDLR